ncbi:MAG: protein kinase, partial [Vicinamibacterales bacterium]
PPPPPAAADLMNSPTITSPATEMGMVLGTAAYMAPEQAKGRAVDRRADLWAFGAVLYEMLTGKRAFEGADISELLVAVLRDDPSHDALPAGTPASIRRLLRRCLEKDRSKRLDSMAAARLEIDEALAGPGADRSAASTAIAAPRWRLFAAAAAAGFVLLAAGATIAWSLKPAPVADRPLARFAILWADGDSLNAVNLPAVALSRDGRRLAYRTGQAIFVRDLADPEPRQVGRLIAVGLWLSPDAEWILIRTPSGLARLPVRGGPAEDLVAAPTLSGASWADDGTIIYSTTKEILRIPETGGSPEVIIRTSTEDAGLSFPQALPNGRLLYTEWRGVGSGIEGGSIISNRDGSNAVTVLKGHSARYLPNGFLLYATEGRAHLVPFDLERERITGPAVPVPETVVVSAQSDWAQIDVSANGTAAFISTRTSENRTSLAWTDANGRTAPALSVPRVYSDLRLSPDGRRVAAHLWDEQNDVWIADLARSTLTRVTFTPAEEETPVWSPDGRELAYASDRSPAPRALVRKSADGGAASPERVIWQHPDHFHVNDWSSDGRTIIVEVRRSGTANDLLAIDVETGKERVLVASTFRERQARLSPDGRWLAFTSDESGRDEVYVQEFPSLARRVTVSTGGGFEPVWSRDGRRLYFRGGGQMLSSSAIGPLEFSAPAPVFADTFGRTQGDTHTHFDVDAAARFLVITSPL